MAFTGSAFFLPNKASQMTLRENRTSFGRGSHKWRVPLQWMCRGWSGYRRPQGFAASGSGESSEGSAQLSPGFSVETNCIISRDWFVMAVLPPEQADTKRPREASRFRSSRDHPWWVRPGIPEDPPLHLETTVLGGGAHSTGSGPVRRNRIELFFHPAAPRPPWSAPWPAHRSHCCRSP
jgi:hypothetical protein